MTDARIAVADADRAGDGGDVAEQRNADTIQREIEQTRAELADTIDAIADRLSPKRMAARSASAVRSQVSSAFGGHNGSGPAAVLDADPAAAGHTDTQARTRAVRAIASRGGGAAYTGTGEYVVRRRLRVDRVLLTVGAVAAVAGGVVLWRSRR